MFCGTTWKTDVLLSDPSVKRSNMYDAFERLNTGIMGANPTRGMDIGTKFCM
jgi:hypothetical protein